MFTVEVYRGKQNPEWSEFNDEPLVVRRVVEFEIMNDLEMAMENREWWINALLENGAVHVGGGVYLHAGVERLFTVEVNPF